MKSKIFEQIDCRAENPTVSGWYDTDKGNLFWFADEKEWSCRDDRVSEEYPKFWYKKQNQNEQIEEKNNETDISNEIKEKVFAQYLRQRWKFKNEAKGFEKATKHQLFLTDINHVLFNPEFKECGGIILILKPLSKITKEDAWEIVRMRYGTGSMEIEEEALLNSAEGITNLIKEGDDCQIKIYQYLQSKGYDMPNYLLDNKTLEKAGLAIYEN